MVVLPHPGGGSYIPPYEVAQASSYEPPRAYSPECVEGEFWEVRVVMKAKEDPASCVNHENCLVSPEELIHLGPALGLIAFLRCVDVLVRRVRTLAAI
jgi:hypothetical protein